LLADQVLMAVLERVLSDQWTESMATAWGGLWQVCSVVFVILATIAEQNSQCIRRIAQHHCFREFHRNGRWKVDCMAKL
jgi:hypothetical protein